MRQQLLALPRAKSATVILHPCLPDQMGVLYCIGCLGCWLSQLAPASDYQDVAELIQGTTNYVHTSCLTSHDMCVQMSSLDCSESGMEQEGVRRK